MSVSAKIDSYERRTTERHICKAMESIKAALAAKKAEIKKLKANGAAPDVIKQEVQHYPPN